MNHKLDDICVNCAECGKEILAEEIAGRIYNRPYCGLCLKVSHLKGGKFGPLDVDSGGYIDIAKRALEEYRDY